MSRRSANRTGGWIRPERREALYRRDRWRCVYCDTVLDRYGPHDTQPSLDHVIPYRTPDTPAAPNATRRAGATSQHDPRNLVACCLACNGAKGPRTVEAWAADDGWGADRLAATLHRIVLARERSWRRHYADVVFERAVAKRIDDLVRAGRLAWLADGDPSFDADGC